MEISIIIVSYNTADLIGKCLSSLDAAFTGNKEVIVVDNASGDGSTAVIGGNFPSVRLVMNKINRGFAAANNMGLSLCRGRYVFFLNPDTEAMPGAFNRAVSYMDANPHVGLAGLKIVNPDGSLQESISYRYPGQKRAGDELKGLKGDIACVLGAAMIVRRESFIQVDGFDEAFFLYGEDQDLCLRIRKAGLAIGYIDGASIVHLGGQSERQSTAAEVWRKKIKAEYIFYKKHYLPLTIRRITRYNHLNACWRILTLKMQHPFAKDKSTIEGKLIKYNTIYEETKKYALLKENLP